MSPQHKPPTKAREVYKEQFTLTEEETASGAYLNCRVCRRNTWHDKLRDRRYVCSSCGTIHA